MSKNTTQCPRPGHKPGPLDPEMSQKLTMRHCTFTIMINKLTDNIIPAGVPSEEQTDVFEVRNCPADKELDAGECSERQGNLKWMAEDWAAKNKK